MIYNYDYVFIIELSNIYYKSKILSIILMIFIFSIAGLPPLLGFLSKLFLIWGLFFQNLLLTGWFCIVMTTVGISFYLRLIKIISFQNHSAYLSWSHVIVFNNNFNYSNMINFSFIFYFLVFYLINPGPIIFVINFLTSYN